MALQWMKVRVLVLKCFLVGVVYLHPRLEHGETLTAALVATFLITYDSYKKTVRREASDAFSDDQTSCWRFWTWYIRMSCQCGILMVPET